MAYSLERRWAQLVVSYARLKKLYEKARERETLLAEQVRDARIEIRELKRDKRSYEGASKRTMERLFATTRYAITRLNAAGDYEAGEKLDDWLQYMEANMQPVANVTHLIELLEEWAHVSINDPDSSAAVWIKTRVVLDALSAELESEE